MNDIKFSILTPDHGRESLKRTWESIEKQTYTNWEHILVFDGEEQKAAELPYYKTTYPKQKRVFTGQNYNDFGHTPRKIGWEACSGDYIVYIDTDDYYAPEALEEIAKGIKAYDYPAFLFFPCNRLGARFFNHPRTRFITSIQYAHKRIDSNNNGISFTSGGYNHDNAWLYEMTNKHDFAMHDTEKELVFVDVIGNGK